MGGGRTARVYGEALFEAAREAGTLKATGADLAAFTAAMRESRELAAVLLNPGIDTATRKRVVAELTAGGDRVFVNGINLVIDKRRPAILFDLERRYQELAKQERGALEVEVVSAIELPDEVRAKIEGRIGEATGRKVLMKQVVREDILGGLVLRFGDVIIDGSLRSRLGQLRARLLEASLGKTKGSDDSVEAAS